MFHRPLFFHAVKMIQDVATDGKAQGKFVDVAEPFKEDIEAIRNLLKERGFDRAKFASDINSVIAILNGVQATAKAEGLETNFSSLMKRLELEVGRYSK